MGSYMYTKICTNENYPLYDIIKVKDGAEELCATYMYM